MLQAKLALEKTKQSLEAEKAELVTELTQVSAGRQEAERKRKQAEQQVAELTLRLNEIEKGRGDLGEKTAKMQVIFKLSVIQDILTCHCYF